MDESLLIKCDFCDDKVTLENGDYQMHLTVVHEVRNGEIVDEILANAVKKLTNQAVEVEDKEFEVITVDDSDDELSNCDYQHVASPIELVKKKTNLEDSINSFFSTLNMIVDGKKPDLSQIDDDFDYDDVEKIRNELPEALGNCFDEIKSLIDNLEIPSRFSDPVDPEVNDQLKTTKLVEKDISKPKKSLDSGQLPLVATDQEKLVNLDKKDVSSRLRPVPGPGQTLLLCPVPNCDFYTTKEGFKNKLAALHLSRDHNVTVNDIVPGKFKFEKIKGEKVKR